MKLAVCSYSFHQLTGKGTMDVFGYLETCKYRYGLRGADIWNGTLASRGETYLAKVREALQERELVLANVCVDGAHIWEDDAEARKENRRQALAHLKAVEFLGARSVRIDAGGGRQDLQWTDEQFEEIVKQYKAYAQRAYDNGYKVGPENHWGAEVVPANVKKLCQAVDSPAFGVLLHVGRWRGDDAEAGDEMVAPWVMHTHFTSGMSDDALVEKMTLLRDTGYEAYYSVELGTARYTEVGAQLARMRDVGERWRLQALGK